VSFGWLAGLVLHLTVAGSVSAPQTVAPAQADTGAGVLVSVLTLGRDAEVWELWGHNTIVVADPGRRTSRSYNWGIFDFRQQNFILRFARGRMYYSMAGAFRQSRTRLLRLARPDDGAAGPGVDRGAGGDTPGILEWNNPPPPTVATSTTTTSITVPPASVTRLIAALEAS
jgi:hypothetical protein